MALKIDKIAREDAAKYAYAEMFFGEGAGTMRKLIFTEVDSKVERIPGYREAFQRAYDKINMADVAIDAAKDRKKIDARKKAGKNFNALIKQDHRLASNGMAAIMIVGGVAVVTGYDKVIVREAKVQYGKAKLAWENHKRKRSGDAKVHNITEA